MLKNLNNDLDISEEYNSIRSEILTWISVQYTLIAVSASVTAISLSVFKGTSYWPWFSGIMIVIVACLGFFTSYANAKITLAAAYITVFHGHRTIWDHLIYSKLKSKWTIATIGFPLPMLLFYLALYSLIVLYVAMISEKVLDFEAMEILLLPTLIYSSMLLVLWRSGRREPYEIIWKEMRDAESGKI